MLHVLSFIQENLLNGISALVRLSGLKWLERFQTHNVITFLILIVNRNFFHPALRLALLPTHLFPILLLLAADADSRLLPKIQ